MLPIFARYVMLASRSGSASGKMREHQLPTLDIAEPDLCPQPSPTCFSQSLIDWIVVSSAISFRLCIRIGKVVKQPVSLATFFGMPKDCFQFMSGMLSMTFMQKFTNAGARNVCVLLGSYLELMRVGT